MLYKKPLSMNIQEKTLGATRMQQRHKGPRPKRVAMFRKQEGIQQDCQADFQTGGREESSWSSTGLQEASDWTLCRGLPPPK
jgi:hypothetical protein